MLSVVVFGNVPLASWVAEKVRLRSDVNFTGVVCDRAIQAYRHHRLDFPCMYEYAQLHGLQVLDIHQLPELLLESGQTMGISVRFPRIFHSSTIRLFGQGLINLHGGELPRYRGVNIANHSILEGATHGAGTIHYIDSGIDTGPVIGREFFPIWNDDTAYDVFLKTQDALMRLFSRVIDGLVSDTIQAVPQQEYLLMGEMACTYRARDIERYRCVSPDLPSSELYTRARAFEFPGHEPAYIESNGKRVYLVTRPYTLCRD